MAFRIDVIADDGRPVVVLAGKLTAEAAEELLKAATPEPAALILDLSDVLFVDATTAGALRTLRDQGAKLVGASRYVELLLEL